MRHAEGKRLAEPRRRQLAGDAAALEHEAAIGLPIPFAEQVRGDEHRGAAPGRGVQFRWRKRRQSGSRLRPGSSSTSTGASGSDSTARARRWRVPPESLPVACARTSPSSHCSCDRRDARRRQPAQPRVERRGSRRRSAARGSAATAAGTTTARAPPCARSPRSAPPIAMRPASGADSPHSCRSVVVLPLPLAPTSSVTSPGRAIEIEPIEDALASVRLGQSGDGDHGRGGLDERRGIDDARQSGQRDARVDEAQQSFAGAAGEQADDRQVAAERRRTDRARGAAGRRCRRDRDRA